MGLDKEKAKRSLYKLTEKFKKELESGRAQEYNEEATKISFIQPFLEDVLGWNVRNHDEVSPEETISKGRVDYGLKVEGTTKVFIEAKPIRADLDKYIEQAIRYGYNKRSVPFVLLTDFEGIKLFDVTVKPDSRNLLKGLKLDLEWSEYLEQFDKLWLLSKESVIKGELDKLLLVKPKDRLPVDKAILDDLKRWRISLAKDIFKNNPELFHSEDREKDAEFLKEITQRILDRIIFMRSCEDRGLTYRPKLKEIFEERTETVGTNTMLFLKEEFKHYNIIFDSDLFRPKKWESNLAIDFKVVRDIVLETYNPYQFDVIPLEVLGNIYEQYLGYTVRLTDHQVKYELKPEVRKAGGVYYTPEYIVDYIVKNTVGKLLKESSQKKIKKLRILDPACGSGSFLIRAYEEMLSYYKSLKKIKSKSKEKTGELELEYEEAEPRLTIEEKSEILRNHIFGVDIDEQAVEVTKLSLMMKMLEGEYGLIHGRSILPILDRNIQCGNSLISGEVLELKKYFGDEWYEVKPFNWEERFEKIMVDEEGFDVLIGNPPWGAEFTEPELAYHRQMNKEIIVRMIDSFMYFVYQGCKKLKVRGHFGMIMPDVILYQKDNEKLREFILQNFKIQVLLNMGDVFEKVTRPASILIFERGTSRTHKIRIADVSGIDKAKKPLVISEDTSFDTILQNYIFKIPSTLFVTAKPTRYSIWIKVKSIPHKLLNDLVDEDGIQRGVSPDLKKAFIVDSDTIQHYDLEKAKLRKVLTGGKQVKRYFIHYQDLWVIYTKRTNNFKELPNICKFIDQFKDEITCGEVKQNKHPLYSLHRPRKERIFLKDKKLIGVITEDEIVVALDDTQAFATDGLYLFSIREYTYMKYVMAILNSKLFVFLYRLLAIEKGRVLAQVKPTILGQLPIRTINFSKSTDKKLHDNLVALVDIMLDLNKKIQTEKGREKEQIQRQIKKTDREIDDLVYRLYGITDEERKIIEETE
jgi:type I restriction-modification system DNA methylase subunit